MLFAKNVGKTLVWWLLWLMRFVSQMFKSIWVFFPSLLFVILGIVIFWTLGQGKDIIIEYAENDTQTWIPPRLVFFMAIGFWVYVSWYSSRIIAYIKISKQNDFITHIHEIDQLGKNHLDSPKKNYENLFEVSPAFLDEFPRLIGNSCFLTLELAVLQSPLLTENPMSATWAIIILALALIGLNYLIKWISDKLAIETWFKKAFWVLFGCLLLIVIVLAFLKIGSTVVKMKELFGLLFFFHIVFIFYINLRRVEMEKKYEAKKAVQEWNAINICSKGIKKLMAFFCIPEKEEGYFVWYLVIKSFGIIFYVSAILWLSFARSIGPFPFIILAFGVLLSFGNIVSALSMRFRINLHFLLFLLAMFLGSKETHRVKMDDLKDGETNHYVDRPTIDKYLREWVAERPELNSDSVKDYPIYFVMANGGASRSGYWTATILGRIEDATIKNNPKDRFSDHVFCLSGTSGGGVGVATFFSLLKDNKTDSSKAWFEKSARGYLKQDYFTYTFARLLGPDYFKYVFHFSWPDRAGALEKSFDVSAKDTPDSCYRVPFDEVMSHFPAMRNGKIYMPLLCINTTQVQDGNPGVATNIRLTDTLFNQRLDVLSFLRSNQDIRISSASILGARFPYLSPAGRIDERVTFKDENKLRKDSVLSHYFVDGGYFDNSGAGVIQEMIRAIVNIGRRDSILNLRLKKLRVKVLHITNSPVFSYQNTLQAISPIKNDLLAPVLTILGAYDMQTTVNDSRLMNYIKDLQNFYGIDADYIPINLYKDNVEWNKDSLHNKFQVEPAYAMNWFMSDTTRTRIDQRLLQQPILDSIIKSGPTKYFIKN